MFDCASQHITLLQDGDTALHHAQHATVASMLLELGADIEAMNAVSLYSAPHAVMRTCAGPILVYCCSQHRSTSTAVASVCPKGGGCSCTLPAAQIYQW